MQAVNAKELAFLQENCKEYMVEQFPGLLDVDKPVILDVGANIGMFAVTMKEKFPQADIHCFEPMPDIYKVLHANVSSFSTCNELAVMETDDIVLKGTYLPNYTLLSGFYVSNDDKQQLEALAHRELSEEFKGIEVEAKTISLHTYMQQKHLEHVHLLKVDVEKAELEVLKSLGESASRVDHIVAEVHQCNKDGMVDWLRANGFTLLTLTDPTLPRYCLQGQTLTSWPTDLNTYILQASRNVLLH
eukprot:TRINITY_DN3657_c0_g1_i1.p1 TRINITY_DN3657_c0_g1~~TRINITY_DN3657_c0_g1_i1.p1  ORF type:complete len:245 (-),score=13.33 TRINITY_DN3657_c0_g1_i1:90-824(-)